MRNLVLFSCVWACAMAVTAKPMQEASAVYAQATSALKQGDLTTAAKQYSAAAKLEPENASYRERALLVYRIARMQKRQSRIEDQERWLKSAYALHQFYLTNQVNELAIKTATEIHTKIGDPASAALLGRTQLEANQNAETAALLQPLSGERATPEVRVLRGIALARTEQAALAKEELADLKLEKTSSAQLDCDVARLQSLLGERDNACQSLAGYLEKTPPSLIEDARAYVERCPDFASLTGHDAFVVALKTKSLVKESSCSGGSSCGACPSSSSCSSTSQTSCSEKTPADKMVKQ